MRKYFQIPIWDFQNPICAFGRFYVPASFTKNLYVVFANKYLLWSKAFRTGFLKKKKPHGSVMEWVLNNSLTEWFKFQLLTHVYFMNVFKWLVKKFNSHFYMNENTTERCIIVVQETLAYSMKANTVHRLYDVYSCEFFFFHTKYNTYFSTRDLQKPMLVKKVSLSKALNFSLLQGECCWNTCTASRFG